MTDPAILELERRLRRYPVDRYPVQHATARFHLGVALADAGDLDAAEAALRAAAALFGDTRLWVEQAKALNALGAVLRLAGRFGEAAAALAEAAESFRTAAQPLEEGAARFNLGLVRRSLREHEGAAAVLEDARRLLDERRVPAQAAAAARELGVTLLEIGDLASASEWLEEAARLCAEHGDRAGLGAALNALGLARLAAGEPAAAVEALRDAAAAHPRPVRPQEHAMAKANLALAHERGGNLARARMAAAQALAVPEAPPPVVEQARAALARLGPPDGAVLAVLDEEPVERWPAVVREELRRLLGSPVEEREAELGRWVEATAGRGADFAEAWLAALLELPPTEFETLVRAIVRAAGRLEPGAAERVRAEVASASARFHVPQLLRLREIFDRAAADLGQRSWS